MVAGACGGGSGADAGPDGDINVPLRGACEAAERLGGFVVEEYEAYSIVEGKAANGIVPVTIPEEAFYAPGPLRGPT